MGSTFIILGSTGSGKSAFANRVTGNAPNSIFKESNDLESASSKTLSLSAKWFGDSKSNTVEVIDTPGLSDTQSLENFHISTSKVNAFVVILNFQQDRFDSNIQQVLKLLREAFNNPKFWEHVIIVYAKCYRTLPGIEELITEKRTKIGERIQSIFPEIKNDIPVFFVDSHDFKDENNNNEFKAFANLVENKPKFDCSEMNPFLPAHVHEWVPVHGESINQVDIHVERFHTGHWGGFLNGWSCCGKGKGAPVWNHNDCHPRNIQTNRLVCSRCGNAPTSPPCSLTCSCKIIRPK